MSGEDIKLNASFQLDQIINEFRSRQQQRTITNQRPQGAVSNKGIDNSTSESPSAIVTDEPATDAGFKQTLSTSTALGQELNHDDVDLNAIFASDEGTSPDAGLNHNPSNNSGLSAGDLESFHRSRASNVPLPQPNFAQGTGELAQSTPSTAAAGPLLAHPATSSRRTSQGATTPAGRGGQVPAPASAGAGSNRKMSTSTSSTPTPADGGQNTPTRPKTLRQELRSLYERVRLSPPSGTSRATARSDSMPSADPAANVGALGPMTPAKLTSPSKRTRAVGHLATSRFASLSAQPVTRTAPIRDRTDAQAQLSASHGPGAGVFKPTATRALNLSAAKDAPIQTPQGHTDNTSDPTAGFQPAPAARPKTPSQPPSSTATQPVNIGSPTSAKYGSKINVGEATVENHRLAQPMGAEAPLPSALAVSATRDYASELRSGSHGFTTPTKSEAVPVQPESKMIVNPSLQIIPTRQMAYPHLKPLRTGIDDEIARVDALLLQSQIGDRPTTKLSPLSAAFVAEQRRRTHALANMGLTTSMQLAPDIALSRTSVDPAIKRSLIEDLHEAGVTRAKTRVFGGHEAPHVFKKKQLRRIQMSSMEDGTYDPDGDGYKIDPRLLVPKRALRSKAISEAADDINEFIKRAYAADEYDDVSSDDGLVEDSSSGEDSNDDDTTSTSSMSEFSTDSEEADTRDSSSASQSTPSTTSRHVQITRRSKSRKRTTTKRASFPQEETVLAPVAHSSTAARLLRSLWEPKQGALTGSGIGIGKSTLPLAKQQLLRDYMEGLSLPACRIAHPRSSYSLALQPMKNRMLLDFSMSSSQGAATKGVQVSPAAEKERRAKQKKRTRSKSTARVPRRKGSKKEEEGQGVKSGAHQSSALSNVSGHSHNPTTDMITERHSAEGKDSLSTNLVSSSGIVTHATMPAHQGGRVPDGDAAATNADQASAASKLASLGSQSQLNASSPMRDHHMATSISIHTDLPKWDEASYAKKPLASPNSQLHGRGESDAKQGFSEVPQLSFSHIPIITTDSSHAPPQSLSLRQPNAVNASQSMTSPHADLNSRPTGAGWGDLNLSRSIEAPDSTIHPSSQVGQVQHSQLVHPLAVDSSQLGRAHPGQPLARSFHAVIQPSHTRAVSQTSGHAPSRQNLTMTSHATNLESNHPALHSTLMTPVSPSRVSQNADIAVVTPLSAPTTPQLRSNTTGSTRALIEELMNQQLRQTETGNTSRQEANTSAKSPQHDPNNGVFTIPNKQTDVLLLNDSRQDDMSETQSQAGTHSRPASAMSWSSSLRKLIHGTVAPVSPTLRVTASTVTPGAARLDVASQDPEQTPACVTHVTSTSHVMTSVPGAENATTTINLVKQEVINSHDPREVTRNSEGELPAPTTSGPTHDCTSFEPSRTIARNPELGSAVVGGAGDSLGVADVYEFSYHSTRASDKFQPDAGSILNAPSGDQAIATRPTSRASHVSTTSSTSPAPSVTSSLASDSSGSKIMAETERILQQVRAHLADVPLRLNSSSHERSSTSQAAIIAPVRSADVASRPHTNLDTSLSTAAAVIAAANAAVAAAKASPFILPNKHELHVRQPSTASTTSRESMTSMSRISQHPPVFNAAFQAEPSQPRADSSGVAEALSANPPTSALTGSVPNSRRNSETSHASQGEIIGTVLGLSRIDPPSSVMINQSPEESSLAAMAELNHSSISRSIAAQTQDAATAATGSSPPRPGDSITHDDANANTSSASIDPETAKAAALALAEIQRLRAWRAGELSEVNGLDPQI